MGSIDKEIRLRQKEKATKELSEKKNALETAGVTGKELERDPTLRRAQAKLRQAGRRLRAIEARAQHVEKVAAEKKAKTQAPKEKKTPAKKNAKPEQGAKKKKTKE